MEKLDNADGPPDTAKDNHDWLYPELLSQDRLVEILRQVGKVTTFTIACVYVENLRFTGGRGGG